MDKPKLYLLTTDEILVKRLSPLAVEWSIQRLDTLEAIDRLTALHNVLVIDHAYPKLPEWAHSCWKKWGEHQRILILSSAPNDDEGLAVLDAGISGYCHAYGAIDSLRHALRIVASGELWVGRKLLSRLIRAVAGIPARDATPAWALSLTEREREVAQHAAMGLSNADIAARLGITERTVKAHMSVVLEKLRVADRLQLALRVHGIK